MLRLGSFKAVKDVVLVKQCARGVPFTGLVGSNQCYEFTLDDLYDTNKSRYMVGW